MEGSDKVVCAALKILATGDDPAGGTLTAAIEPRDWLPKLAPYRDARNGRALVELGITAVPFAALWLAMWLSLGVGYWLTLLLAVPAAGFLVRLFMIQHDCGHGSFFHGRRANDRLGRVIGVLTLTPYSHWRHEHALHHATSGNLDRRGRGDVDTLTVREFQALPGWRRWLYRKLALGWTGSDREWHALERAMKLMAGIILAVAVSVHTVVAWDFSMAIAPMWHSTIFGPYFVAGAIFSGIAALILAMAVIRKTMRLEQYLTPHHFNNLAKLLLLMSLLWTYFTIAENLTVWYGNEPKEMMVFGARARGTFAPYFWTMVVCNFFVPFVLLGIRKLRSIKTAVIASVTVLIGMWLERYIIIVPTLSRPRLAASWGSYAPTWVEISITVATFATMVVLYLTFAKLFPIISIWEFKPHDRVPER